jgi:hypothetical protein
MSKSKRKRRKRPTDRPSEPPRHFGVEATLLWIVTLGFWARTAVWFYNEKILRRHDEMYAAVLLVDVLVPVLAIVLTMEWWRRRRGPGGRML